jgi:hypothetical protein
MRIAIYARFSSDRQRDASIEDQVRLCSALAERLGGSVIRALIEGVDIRTIEGKVFDIELTGGGHNQRIPAAKPPGLVSNANQPRAAFLWSGGPSRRPASVGGAGRRGFMKASRGIALPPLVTAGPSLHWLPERSPAWSP